MTEMNSPVVREVLPPNVRVGAGTEVLGEKIFRRFFSECDPAIVLGEQLFFDPRQVNTAPS